MPVRPHRPPELRAKRHALAMKHPSHVEEFLRKFPKEHRAGILARLVPHLTFELPKRS